LRRQRCSWAWTHAASSCSGSSSYGSTSCAAAAALSDSGSHCSVRIAVRLGRIHSSCWWC
jgi:hypothetical protein